MKELIEKIKQFSKDRDWSQFHNSKDLAIAISLESSELLELFLWKENEDFDISNLKRELADILVYSILLAEKHNLDIQDIIEEKLIENGEKYPINKSKGNSKKYFDL